ncbi:MAG TPA: major capsid protein [Casimicrobiaceae bacterium]|jgi:hypothetical protein|nr:major capsid protein [Casimicrobiaceae bacterium]
MLDIFRGDAFGVVPLSIAINNLKFVPGYISGRGLFNETAIATTVVAIEEKNNILTLVAPTPRGGPGHTMPKPRRSMRMLGVPHFEINDAIMAEEVQGVRPFGQETGTEAVMTKVAERMQSAGQSLEYTQEYSRVGAVKGIVTYADGTTLNLFNEYGITPPAAINFVFSATTNTGAVRQQCAALIRTMGANLDGQGFTGVEAICGDAFFDALIGSLEVRSTYLNTQDAAELRSAYISGGQTWGSFAFGGILWTNYRGYAQGAPMVETDLAYFYPTGVPNLFPTIYAPADYIETVNTMGLPRYVKQYDMPNDKGVHMDTQMNALNFCSRPLALLKGTHS